MELELEGTEEEEEKIDLEIEFYVPSMMATGKGLEFLTSSFYRVYSRLLRYLDRSVVVAGTS